MKNRDGLEAMIPNLLNQMGKSGRRKRTVKLPRVLGGKRPHYNAGNAQYERTVYGTCPLCRFEGPSHSPRLRERGRGILGQPSPPIQRGR